MRANCLLDVCDCDIEFFYNMRTDVVHASFIDSAQHNYLEANISKYENILRKSILAFYYLNNRFKTKEETLNELDQSQSDPQTRRNIQESLKVLNFAR